MPRTTPDFQPSYRFHKQSGQAIVTLSGRDHLLGPHGSAASHAKYHALISQWIANGRRPIDGRREQESFLKPEAVTVGTLCDAFQRHADVYYALPGKRTNGAALFKLVLADVRDLYGTTAADEFSPTKLKMVREKWIARNYVRNMCNRYTSAVRQVFKWGIENELCNPSVLLALQAVAPLKFRKSAAKESLPVRPVPLPHVDAIKPFVARQVWALANLQLCTGARGDELFRLRAIDIDTTGDVWTATLAEHKTAGRGKERVLCFGPRARVILDQFMSGRSVDAPLFSPREAAAERKAATATKGKPRRQSQRPNRRKTGRVIGETYDDASYRRAIQRACVLAGVPKWHPHQLRHNFSTEVRRRHGIEAARAATGHSSIDTTQIYAERDRAVALKIASEVG